MGFYSPTDVLFSYGAGGSLSDATYSRASAATYRNRRGVVSTASSTGVSRLGWYDVDGDGGWEQPGLLIEGARTNQWTYSEQLDNAAWTKSKATIAANAATAPDGSTTADKLVEDSSTNTWHTVGRNSTGAEDTLQTVSVFAKAAERSWLRMRYRDHGGVQLSAWFDLSLGAVGTVSTALAGTAMEPDQNGWYECAIIADSSTGTATPDVVFAPATADNSAVNDGSTTSGLYLWGGQFEEDGAFPTSYIPTSSASVSRAADALTFPRRFGVQDVTVYMKVKRPTHADVTGDIGLWADVVRIGGGSGNGRTDLYFNKTSRQVVTVLVGGDGVSVAAIRTMPSGDPIEAVAQYRNLTTDPQTRVDVGAGFAGWTSTGGTTPFHSFASTSVLIDDAFCGIESIKVSRGLKTLSDMRDLRTDHGA